MANPQAHKNECSLVHSTKCPPGHRTRIFYGLFRILTDSMTGEDILPGDEIIVRLTLLYTPNDICALVCPDGLQLRRVIPLPTGRLLLRPGNPTFGEKDWPPEAIKMIGVLKRKIRRKGA